MLNAATLANIMPELMIMIRAIVGYLVQESEPGVHVSDVTGFGKVLDGREILRKWLYLGVGDLEPS